MNKMPDKKLTDNEIVKEFQLRTLKAEHPGFILCGQIVDLINRLQAEIERLRYNLEAVLDERADHSEAYKEFAERLHCHCQSIINEEWNKKVYPTSWADAYEEFDDVVDNLLNELVGDKE